MKTPTNINNPVDEWGELKEKLAAIEHERWADWQRWCHKVLREANPSPEIGDILERWDRQIETPYAGLSEKEKDSDREQVDRYLPLIKSHIEQMIGEARKELIFDMDEIDNKPWRVFRQLAKIMPEYEEEYIRYEAFYSFGGGHKVKELIEAFMLTDDFKESYFADRIATLTKEKL